MNDSACGADGASCSACGSGRECNAGACTTLTSTCDVDTGTIDFRSVAVRSTQQRTFSVTNNGRAARSIELEFTSNSSNRISVAPSGAVVIAEGATQVFTITLDTTLSGPATATLALKRDQSCSSDVSITANVLDSVLTYEPATVNFGYAAPGATVKREVTVRNLGADAVTLRQLVINDQAQTVPSTIFTYAGATTLEVPAEGSVTLELAFKPSILGPRQGQLKMSTSLSSIPMLSVPLRGIGGGPKIDVPSTLVFQSTLVNTTREMPLPVRNIGFRPNPADPAANLRIDRLTFTALANTSAQEFVADYPPTYDVMNGIESGSVVNFPVWFTPLTPGPKSFELLISSNDALSPDVTVTVSMEAVVPAPCTYTVTPSVIDFGTPRAGTSLDWPVVITNTGTTDCNVLDARTSSTAPFTVRNFTAGIIAPGASKRFHVRYTQGALVAGAMVPGQLLHISTNASTTPTTDIPLVASAEPTCILTPTSVDFGSAPVGCRSADLPVPVLNTCTSPVTAGGATIMGSTEFSLMTSGIGPLTARSGRTLTARYLPDALGADEAFIVFSSNENSRVVRHVIPLRGEGSTGTVTERYAVGSPKLDLLFAIDDSPSMTDEQNTLATALASFGMYATANSIDVRFAATTADLASTARGTLRRTSANVPFVSSSTPNAGTELGTLIRLGATGGLSSCLTSAAEALSDERRFDSNAGFLRDDAHLGVICLTDSPDSTPNLPPFEFDRLALVRGPQRRDAFSYSVVGPFLPMAPSGCTYDGANTSVHDMAVAVLSGAREEICNVAPSVGAVLASLVERPARGFMVTRAADLSTTPTVTVDGTAVPASDWTIDAVTGRVTFSAAAALSPGRTATVTYAPLCY
ncbi:MAG: choice-of-anchor D domain-containing protein [Archangium sp.]